MVVETVKTLDPFDIHSWNLVTVFIDYLTEATGQTVQSCGIDQRNTRRLVKTAHAVVVIKEFIAGLEHVVIQEVTRNHMIRETITYYLTGR